MCEYHKATATQFAASLPLPGEINDGEKDIGDTPISLLLLRYLDPISTEDTVRNKNNNTINTFFFFYFVIFNIITIIINSTQKKIFFVEIYINL